MGKINLLPPSVAELIAAGEVIDLSLIHIFSQPDRASGGDQHKAEPRCEGFSLFHFHTLLF